MPTCQKCNAPNIINITHDNYGIPYNLCPTCEEKTFYCRKCKTDLRRVKECECGKSSPIEINIPIR